jgi:hypothetical protein
MQNNKLNMSMVIMKYPFLHENEEVVYELKTETGVFLVTNTRFITQKTLARGKGQFLEEFHLKYVAHSSIEASKGRDDRLIGAIIAIIGIMALVVGYYAPEYGYTPLVIGGLVFISGIVLFLSKVEPTGTITIELIELQKEFKFEIDAPENKSIQLWKHLRTVQKGTETPAEVPD